MLKMYIDNEEVVSKNDFTIKEEMLSASSTILNNTYPKSWELDHDYISRFYYPKDYSKLVLNKETYFPHLDGSTIEGSSFQINADTTLEDDYYFKGNTTQDGTPTPTTPIPIEVATGLQDVSVYGKNWFNINGNVESATSGYSISDTTLTVPTSAGNGGQLVYSKLYPGGTYKMSFTKLRGTIRIVLRIYNNGNLVNYEPPTGFSQYNGTYQGYFKDCSSSPIDVIVPNNYQFKIVFVYTNWSVKDIQLEKGSTSTNYEPFIGQDYKINLGKNLISFANITNSNNGLDGSINGNTLTISGTNSKTDANWGLLTNQANQGVLPKFEKGVKYTVSSTNQITSSLYFQINYFKEGTGTQASLVNFSLANASYTFTIPNDYNGVASAFIGVYSTARQIDYTTNLQIEKGSVATSYAPYFTPIELCKIGTYQDRIFKNTLTSPYYDSNLELDKWYLYKEIGKVILTGDNSEGWALAATYTNNVRYNSANIKLAKTTPLISNYFLEGTGGTDTTNIDTNGTTGQLMITIPKTIASTAADFKTWLGTHNTIVYYQLEIPTCTEITNTTLINELESIELLNGLNNISIASANLPMIMNLHYNYQTEHTDIDVIFSGMVKNTNNISLNPREPKYCGLEILDYKTLLSEGKTLDYVISNKTILEAITMVVNSISEYGFELGNVNILNGDEIIGAYSTENKTAYDVLQYLADISGAKWNCRRKDNSSMYIDFYDPTLMPRGTQIDYTTEWACNNNLVDLKFNYGTRDYRNKQIILSDEVEGNIEYNDRLSSDGVSKEYTLPYKIATLNKIEIEGVEQSIATKEEKEVGIYADFYYSRDTDSFTSNKLLPYGTLIDVSYTPIIKGREVVQNDNEIERLTNQLEVNGTISRYESRNDTTDSNKLINIGETYLRYKGEAEITLTIKTFNNNLYNVGQVVYFNAPIPELQRDYLVKSKQIQVISSDEDTLNIFYTFTLSSSFNAEKEINWFDNQRAKTEGNIGEGEFISRNIDINSKANIIWDNLRVEEVSLPAGASNDLQASLEAPIIH